MSLRKIEVQLPGKDFIQISSANFNKVMEELPSDSVVRMSYTSGRILEVEIIGSPEYVRV